MPKKVKAIFQLKVSLRDIEPSIWRSLQVAEHTKLPRLHRVLQLLFNWEDYHLHDFIVGRRVYSVPDPDDSFNERKVIDERRVPLNRIVDRVGDSCDYATTLVTTGITKFCSKRSCCPLRMCSIHDVSRARGMDRRKMQAALAAMRITSKRSPTRTTRNTRTWRRGAAPSIPRRFQSMPSTRL